MNERRMVIRVDDTYYLLTAWEAEEDLVTCADLEVLSASKYAWKNMEEYHEFMDSDPIAPMFDSHAQALEWGKRVRF
jgi:hypothetical protein